MLTFSKNSVATLEKKSGIALDIFNKTIADLSNLNSQIDTEAEEKQKQIEILTAESNQLNALKEKHNKVIGKIQSLFQD